MLAEKSFVPSISRLDRSIENRIGCAGSTVQLDSLKSCMVEISEL